MELTEEMRLISPAWRQRVTTAEDVRQFLVGSGFLMAHRVLRSFLDAQLVVAERLASSDPAVRATRPRSVSPGSAGTVTTAGLPTATAAA